MINGIECRMLIRWTTRIALNPSESIEFCCKEVTMRSRNGDRHADVQQNNDECLKSNHHDDIKVTMDS